MRIICTTPLESGAYDSINDNWPLETPPDGYYQIADDCNTSAMQTHAGFVTLTVEGDIVTAITGDDAAYQAYLNSLPTPATPEPTIEEKNRADIDYLSVMTGVTL